jgi:hypothetical protein
VVATGVTAAEGVSEAGWPGGTNMGGESNEVAAPCFVVTTTLFGAPTRTVGIVVNGPGLSQLSDGLGYNIKSRS